MQPSARLLALVAVATAAVAAAPALDATSRAKPPFGGRALGETGLRLVVAANPPFSVDVDSGLTERIDVPGLEPNTVTWLRRVGRSAIVVASPGCGTCRDGTAFSLRPGVATASPLGDASDAVPTSSGGAWLLSRATTGPSCTIRQVAADGGTRVAPREVPCGSIEATSGTNLILHAGTDLLFEPSTGRVALRAPHIVAATQRYALTGWPGALFLRDTQTGARHKLRWPSALSRLGDGAAQPHGRLIAVAFLEPPPVQYLEVWLLDPVTRRFSRVPGDLAEDAYKFTTMSWTEDGRLVLLTRWHDRDAIAVWRPGERTFASGYLGLPARSAGNVAMIAW